LSAQASTIDGFAAPRAMPVINPWFIALTVTLATFM
jgi:hypothetical protein